MKLPKISIVTPSFNQAQFVEQTVRSIILQRYPRLEYIFMDGGSTDGTQAIVERYRPFLSHYESAPDKGQADALRRGFTISTGEIMAYLNTDDLLAPGALFEVARFFAQNPEIDAVYSHRCTIDASNKVLWYWLLPPHSDYLMRRWDLVPQETLFWRRGLFEKAGGIDTSYQFAIDFDMLVRFMKIGRLHRLDRFLGAFRNHGDSKTNQLMSTVGVKEMGRIWYEHRTKPHAWDKFLFPVFKSYTELRGDVFRRTYRTKAGILPGSGYNYDKLWGYQLADSAIPIL